MTLLPFFQLSHVRRSVMFVDLADGYSLHHISNDWHLARERTKGAIPYECPKLGVSCWWTFIDRDGDPWDYWVGCVGLFPTGGEWMLAEYLTFTDDGAVSGRVRNEAFKRTIPVLAGIATCHNSRLLVPSSSKGVTAILRNMGVAYSSGLDLLVGS
jgi:hypothetical protein